MTTKEYMRQYWETHKEVFREAMRRYRQRKPKTGRDYLRNYRLTHPWITHWDAIRARCRCKTHASYKWYGGKGIKASLTREDLRMMWFRDKAFEMSYPSVNRIDSNGHYTLKNCRFMEVSENVRRKQPPVQGA